MGRAPETGNQREMREIVQALGALDEPAGKLDLWDKEVIELRRRAIQAVKNHKLTKDEKLVKARDASIASRQEQTRRDRLLLRNIIREIEKHDPELTYTQIDIELRKRGFNPLRATHWSYRVLREILITSDSLLMKADEADTVDKDSNQNDLKFGIAPVVTRKMHVT